MQVHSQLPGDNAAPESATQGLFWSYLLFLAWIPLPLGSNRIWAWSIAELWVFVMVIWWLTLYLRGRVSLPSSVRAAKGVFLIFGLWLLLLIFQIIPLPIDWMGLLSPASLVEQMGEHKHRSTISLYPYATSGFLLKSLMYVALFFLSLCLLIDRTRIRRLLWLLVFVGLFQALYGTMMVLTEIEYGFLIKKEHHLGVATGTFANRNHLAGLLEMTLAAGIGLLLSDTTAVKALNWRQRLRNLTSWILSSKMRLRIYLAVMVIGLILTHSRMGNIAFFSALIITGFIWLLASDRKFKGPAMVLLMSLLAIDFYLVGTWFGIDEVVDRLEQTSLEVETRDDVLKYTLPYFRAFPFFGSGGGTFSSVFPLFRGEEVKHFYHYAHNDYIQTALETGIVGLLLLGGVTLLSLIVVLRVMMSQGSHFYRALSFTSFMGVLSILIHSLTDFNLQIPSNTSYFTIFMALGWAAWSKRSATEKKCKNNQSSVLLRVKTVLTEKQNHSQSKIC